MNQLAVVSQRFVPGQVALIKNTVAHDTNATEFDQFLHVAANLGLDPLRKQIYAFVFSKDDVAKRKMAIVTGIDGYRAIADRSKNYRPGDRTVRRSKKLIDPDTNPEGIEYAEATVYKFSHGDWHPITERVNWKEFAPIVAGGGPEDYTWETVKDREGNPVLKDNGKPKYRKVLNAGADVKPRLDPNKENWIKMPDVMLKKCAEAQAIRRGWPEETAGVYVQDEMDRAMTIDLTASEMAEQANVESRLQMVKGANAVMFDMGDAGLTNLPLGKAGDMIADHINKLQPFEVMQWRNVNRVPLQEFWARAKSDALEIKKLLDKAEAKVSAETVEAGNRDLEG